MPTIPKRDTPYAWKETKKQWNPRRYVDVRYQTQRWRRARSLFRKLNPLCNECGRLGSCVDHIKPVRLGGEFWDEENWQTLCYVCHNRKSGREAHQQPE